MIARLWRTSVDEDPMEEYRRFEQRRSEPMFRALEGCLGVLFLRTGTGCAALSFWRDQDAVAQLATNRRYQRTVRSLAETGLLRGDQTVDLLEVNDGFLTPAFVTALGAHPM